MSARGSICPTAGKETEKQSTQFSKEKQSTSSGKFAFCFPCSFCYEEINLLCR